MSNYHAMWEEVKKLDAVELEEWIVHIHPVEGKAISFEGIDVLDVDLIEALRLMKEELLYFNVQPNFD